MQFDYDIVALNDLQVRTQTNDRTGGQEVSDICVKDELFAPSERFWTSLFARFGFNKAFFKYFGHAEVFNRISEAEPSDKIRICVERNDGGSNRLLAVSNPTKPVARYDDVMGLLEQTGHEGVTYIDGIIDSTHRPRVGSSSFDISGDLFSNQFHLNTPIDGYGAPSAYLALLREVCSNGMIALTRAFRSQIALGRGDDDVVYALARALDQFNNDEGFAALRQRVESATTSWASVYEATNLYKLLVKLHHTRGDGGHGQSIGTDGASVASTPLMRKLLIDNKKSSAPMGEDEQIKGSPIITAYHALTGDTSALYGLANLDALSAKRQRTLPVRATVYDLFNFATEVATHHATTGASRRLNAYVGDMLTGEYDMEGTCDKYSDFADFHIDAKLSSGLTGSN